MPQVQTSPAKEKRLSIRATESQKVILAQAAQLRRKNVSQFVLDASLDAANAVLVDQTTFHLPIDQWDAFCRRLDEPAMVIPALQQLFSGKDPF